MVTDTRTGGDSRRERLAKTLAVYGVAIPVVVLAVLYAASSAAGVNFGNVVFLLTIVTTVAALVLYGMGGRMDAARPSGELFRNSATRYGADPEEPSSLAIPGPALLVVVLVGTVVLGWVFLVATL